MRDRDLTSDEQVLARATKLAVQAADGLEVCSRETGKSDSQLSRCCSPYMPDSLTIRDAVIIESIGYGKAGHPHILRAMARLLGFVVVPLPTVAGGDDSLLKTEALRDGKCDAHEAAGILIQLDEHDTVSARLRCELNAIVAEEPK
jgi:hypothetical protein